MLAGMPIAKQAMMASAPVMGATTVWHRRFSHLGYDNLQQASKVGNGLPAGEVASEGVAGKIFRPCAKSKMARAPFPESTTKTGVMELMHMDITGPFPTSLGGSRYLIVLYENSAGMPVLVPIFTKSGAGRVLKGKIPEIERRSGKS